MILQKINTCKNRWRFEFNLFCNILLAPDYSRLMRVSHSHLHKIISSQYFYFYFPHTQCFSRHFQPTLLAILFVFFGYSYFYLLSPFFDYCEYILGFLRYVMSESFLPHSVLKYIIYFTVQKLYLKYSCLFTFTSVSLSKNIKSLKCLLLSYHGQFCPMN